MTNGAVAIHASVLAVIWIGLTIVLIGAGELVTHSAAIVHFDRHITSFVVTHRPPALDVTMKVVTWAGSWVAVAVTGCFVMLLVVMRRLPLVVLILTVVAWLGEFATVNIVKAVVSRRRPPQNVWLVNAHGGSFPSGHAANATLVSTCLVLVILQRARPRAAWIAAWAVAFLAIVTVGFSRVELGVHWTTDVIASVVVVAGWQAAIAFLFISRLPPPSSNSSPSDNPIDPPEPVPN